MAEVFKYLLCSAEFSYDFLMFMNYHLLNYTVKKKTNVSKSMEM